MPTVKKALKKKTVNKPKVKIYDTRKDKKKDTKRVTCFGR